MTYYQKNKERITEYRKEYILKNKEQIKERRKEYRLNTKEHIKEYQKEYGQTPNGIKSRRIIIWKKSGVIHEDFNKLYELYINTNECNVCHKTFKNTKDRHLDHSHENGEFRYVLCQSCNIHDNWKKIKYPPE